MRKYCNNSNKGKQLINKACYFRGQRLVFIISKKWDRNSKIFWVGFKFKLIHSSKSIMCK